MRVDSPAQICFGLGLCEALRATQCMLLGAQGTALPPPSQQAAAEL